MKHEMRHNEVKKLCDEIKILIDTTPPPDLSGMVELAALDTDGVDRFECSRKVAQNETKEQIDIEFDDNTSIVLYSVNGYCTMDIV